MRLGEILVKKGYLEPQQIRQFLNLLGTRIMHCPGCGKNYNVKNWSPGIAVHCRSCRTALVAPPTDFTLDASDTQTLPEELGTRDPRDQSGKPFGRYRLLKELGRGGMGVVWKAWDTQLKRVVALKHILAEGGDEDFRLPEIERFLREARAAAKLRHPNPARRGRNQKSRPISDLGIRIADYPASVLRYPKCAIRNWQSTWAKASWKSSQKTQKIDNSSSIVQVYDVGTLEGRHYLTMECIEGESLQARISRKKVSVRRALELIRDVARALYYAHREGIIHRDVKPANILLDEKDKPYVMDFGLAKDVSAGKTAGLTRTGDIFGTPRYMSPEQASGRARAITPASDQFSLGAVLYQMLTGRAPFHGQSLRDLLNEIIEKDPIQPRALNRRLHRDVETICLKALEKHPSRRYRNMAQFADDLDRYLQGEPIVARPLNLFEKVSRKVRRHKALAVAAGIILLIGAIALLYGKVLSRKAQEKVREAHRELKEREEGIRERVEDVEMRLAELVKQRDYGVARSAYEELLQGTLNEDERQRVELRIEELQVLERLQRKLAKAMSAETKKGEILSTRDGKKTVGDVVAANNDFLVIVTTEGSIDIPWAALTQQDYGRLLGEYFSNPRGETAFDVGVYAFVQGKTDAAKQNLMRAWKDAALREQVEAYLSRMGIETEEMRRRKLAEEQQRFAEAEEERRKIDEARASAMLARSTLDETLEKAWKLAKSRNLSGSIELLERCFDTPEVELLREELQQAIALFQRAHRAFEGALAYLRQQRGNELTLFVEAGTQLVGKLVSVDDTGRIELALSGGTRSRLSLDWESVSPASQHDLLGRSPTAGEDGGLDMAVFFITQDAVEQALKYADSAWEYAQQNEFIADVFERRGLVMQHDGQIFTREELGERGLYERSGELHAEEDLERSGWYSYRGRAFTLDEARLRGLVAHGRHLYSEADVRSKGLFVRQGLAYSDEDLKRASLFGRDGLAYTAEELATLGLYGYRGRALTKQEVEAEGLFMRDGVAYAAAELAKLAFFGYGELALTREELAERGLYGYEGQAYSLRDLREEKLFVYEGSVHGKDALQNEQWHREIDGKRYVLWKFSHQDADWNALEDSDGLFLESPPEGLVLSHRSHLNPATLQFSPDGTLVACADRDSTVIIWDVATGQVVHRFRGNPNDVAALRFLRRGRQLACAGYSKSGGFVTVWNVAENRIARSFSGNFSHAGWSYLGCKAAISPDGKVWATIAHEDDHVYIDLFNLATGKAVKRIKPSGTPKKMTFSPDGELLVADNMGSSANENGIKLWDASTGVEKMLLSPVSFIFLGGIGYQSLAFSPDNRLLAISGDEKTAIVSLKKKELLHQVDSMGLSLLVFHPRGKMLAGAGEEGLRIWELRKGRTVVTVPWVQGPIVFRPDGRAVAYVRVEKGEQTIGQGESEKDTKAIQRTELRILEALNRW